MNLISRCNYITSILPNTKTNGIHWCHFRHYISHKAAKSVAKLISQLCGELQPAVYLSRGYVAIWRWPEHSLMFDRPQNQATAEAAWATFILAWIVSQCAQLLFDGEKCVLLLCVWKPAFLKYSHTHTPTYTCTCTHTHTHTHTHN